MKILSFIAFFCIVLGCNSGKQTSLSEDTSALTKPDGTNTDTTEATPSSQSSKKIKSFKGLYISGDEISTFRDCNTGKTYWLEDESKNLNKIYQKTKSILSYPYESIYVEVKGYLKGKSAIGYAEEFENVLMTTEVVAAKQKSFNTDCFKYDFIALGNEPFWSLDIIPSEKILVLKDVGTDKTHVFPYKSATTSGNQIIYETSNNKNETLKAVITKATCSDGMSDRTYNYSAQVIINGKTLNGCAIKKGDKITMGH